MNDKPAIPRVLMCKPTHFGVDYEINPWMQGQVGQTDQMLVMQQWDALVKRIGALADVEVFEPGDAGRGLPDMAFIANAGLILDDVFVPSVFSVPQRAAEVPHFVRWFEANGFTIQSLPQDMPFEGEGDALFHPGQPLLWAGHGQRSGDRAHARLRDIFDVQVVSLKLVDPRFYHLDTCFVPLPGGKAVYYPGAFDQASRQAIEERITKENRIEVGEGDALRFACNAVPIGNTIICNDASQDLKTRLNDFGYTVCKSPVDQFMRSGGGCKCLTLLLQQDLGQQAKPNDQPRETPLPAFND